MSSLRITVVVLLFVQCRPLPSFIPSAQHLQVFIDQVYQALNRRDYPELQKMADACELYPDEDRSRIFSPILELQNQTTKLRCRHRIGKRNSLGAALDVWCDVRRGGLAYEDLLDVVAINPALKEQRTCNFDFSVVSVDVRRRKEDE